jgi:pentatricopeptide repeat protein
MIDVLCAGAQWERARQVFEQMQQQGCTPDVVTYTALISAYERGGQWQRALSAFQQMCMQVRGWYSCCGRKPALSSRRRRSTGMAASAC